MSETARYIAAIERGAPVTETRRRLSASERLGDALITGLRLAEGVELATVERRYGVDLRARYGAEVRGFVDAGWMVDGRRPVAPDPARHAGIERGRQDFRLTWAVR